MAGVAILYACQKKKKDVGKACDFSDSPPSVIVDIQPDHKLQNQHRLSLASEYEGNNIPALSECGTNTERKSIISHGQLHLEGCWPKDVGIHDIGHRLRYRKKSEKDDTYIPSLKALVTTAKSVLRQNNSIDIYQQYYESYDKGKSASKVMNMNEEDALQVVTVLGDPLTGNMKTGRIPTTRMQRTVAALSWQPEGVSGRRLCVAYSNMRYPYVSSSSLQSGESLSSYIWDLNCSSSPEVTLQPTSQLSSVEFNPRDLHLVGGGCHNGTLCFFDCRRGGSPVSCTPLFGDNAATSPCGGAIRGMTWLQPSGRGQELLAIDGSSYCKVWDTRQLREPVDSIKLSNPNQKNDEEAISVAYNPNFSSHKFIAGTMRGFVHCCSRKNRSEEKTSLYEGHHGPVYNVDCNPLIPKIFLSVGDWATRIYSEDHPYPLLTTRYAKTHMVDAFWHPLHPGVFITTLLSGKIEVYNMGHKMRDPLMSTQISNDCLHCSKIHPDGEKIGVGSNSGQVHIVKMSSDLLNSDSICAEPLNLQREKDLVTEILDREVKREMATKPAPPPVFQPPPCRPPPSEAELRDLTAMFISELGQCSVGEDVRHRVAKLRETFLAEGREAEISLRKAEEAARNEPRGLNISAASSTPIQVTEANLLAALDGSDDDVSSESS